MVTACCCVKVARYEVFLWPSSRRELLLLHIHVPRPKHTPREAPRLALSQRGAALARGGGRRKQRDEDGEDRGDEGGERHVVDALARHLASKLVVCVSFCARNRALSRDSIRLIQKQDKHLAKL